MPHTDDCKNPRPIFRFKVPVNRLNTKGGCQHTVDIAVFKVKKAVYNKTYNNHRQKVRQYH